MAVSLIPPPAKMDMSGDRVANWQFFKASWENYIVATEIDKKDASIQVATLKTLMGKECYEVCDNLPLTDAQRKSPTEIVKHLGEHFEPQRNVVYERFVFNSCKQEQREPIDSFLSRLRKLASTCAYGPLRDEMIRDRIVVGVTDNHIRSRLLREALLTLQKALDICRSSEQAAIHLQQMESVEVDTAHYVMAKKPAKKETVRSCKYCGKYCDKGKCPAFGTTCSKCSKRHHFPEVCRSSSNMGKDTARDKKGKSHKLHQVAEDDSDDSIYTVTVNTDGQRRQYFVELAVESPARDQTETVRFQLDSGATCSTLRLADYQKLSSQPPQPSNANLRVYNGTVIKPVGTASLRCHSSDTCKKVHFEIVADAPTSLLSGRAGEALGLVKFAHEQMVHTVTSSQGLTQEQVLDTYSDVFTGLGKLPGHYHIEVDPAVKPVQNTRRRVPIPVREELKAKLNSMEQQGVISKVTEPTKWISNMVVVRKPNKIRLCLDPYNLNKAIQRSHYPIPTVDEIAPRLQNAKVFSVADAKDGFLQVLLDEPSSYLTTFWTPYGRYRWLRMPFGISSAPEEIDYISPFQFFLSKRKC